MQFLIFLFDFLLQFLDDKGHLFVVSAFLCLELADEAVDVVFFLLLKELELHLICLALYLYVEMSVLLDPQ